MNDSTAQVETRKILIRIQLLFKDVIEYCEKIIESRILTRKAIKSIANLKEQFMCCERAKAISSPLDHFPRVIEDVQLKISMVIEQELVSLSKDM